MDVHMPVSLSPAHPEVWLDPADHNVDRLQFPPARYPSEASPLSTRVNTPANDTRECVTGLA